MNPYYGTLGEIPVNVRLVKSNSGSAKLSS